MTATHTDAAAGRWYAFSPMEQMANIGSEVGRALNARRQGKRERSRAALERGLELFDLTVADPRWRGGRLRELLRVREIVCDYFVGGNTFRSTPESLERYFLTFAAAVRRGR